MREDFGYANEMTSEFQAGMFRLDRNKIPGEWKGKNTWPRYHNYEWPKSVDISKWYHYCLSYSTILHKIRLFQDGLKVYSFEFQDDIEDPLPSNTFEKVQLGENFPGLITDLN